jgi:hypothetical protein
VFPLVVLGLPVEACVFGLESLGSMVTYPSEPSSVEDDEVLTMVGTVSSELFDGAGIIFSISLWTHTDRAKLIWSRKYRHAPVCFSKCGVSWSSTLAQCDRESISSIRRQQKKAGQIMYTTPSANGTYELP